MEYRQTYKTNTDKALQGCAFLELVKKSKSSTSTTPLLLLTAEELKADQSKNAHLDPFFLLKEIRKQKVKIKGTGNLSEAKEKRIAKKMKALETPGIEPDVGVEPTTLRLRVSRSTD